LEQNCWNKIVGTKLLEQNCWNKIVGTKLLEQNCRNKIVGTKLLEQNCWNKIVGTKLFEQNCSNKIAGVLQSFRAQDNDHSKVTKKYSAEGLKVTSRVPSAHVPSMQLLTMYTILDKRVQLPQILQSSPAPPPKN
jgi:hypothetical protein